MTATLRLLAMLCAWGVLLASRPAAAAEFTFRFINDSDRPLALKLFSRAESLREWPAKTKSYSLRPDGAAVQELRIDCEEGERICWGAWMRVETVSGTVGGGGKRDTRITRYSIGAGERGLRECQHCCSICQDGGTSPVARLRDPDGAAR